MGIFEEDQKFFIVTTITSDCGTYELSAFKRGSSYDYPAFKCGDEEVWDNDEWLYYTLWKDLQSDKCIDDIPCPDKPTIKEMFLEGIRLGFFSKFIRLPIKPDIAPFIE